MTNGITGAIQGRVWSGIGLAIGLLIVVVAGAALFRLVVTSNLDEVVAALHAKSIRDVVIAGGFVLTGYLTLTFYDFFALRTIGRNAVPYRIAALAAFTSYAIGHNLGATVFTGGAIRFRIYSAWGLGIIDVAKIAFVTGLTFWLGNAFLLGFGMSYAPAAASAVNQLPAWVNRADRIVGAAVHRRLSDLAHAAATRLRAVRLANCPPGLALDPGPDRDRGPGSQRGGVRDVHCCPIIRPSISSLCSWFS